MSPRAFQHRRSRYSMLGKCRNSKSAEAWKHNFKYTGIYSSLFHIFLPPSAQLLTSQSSDEKSSSTIETVAYIILAHVSKPDLSPNDASVSKLVRWLSAQRNAFGGFASTQVTKQGKSWGKELLCLEWCAHLSCARHSRPILCIQRYMSPVCSGKGSAMGKFFSV